MANIRDQCSWVHARDPSAATEKAKSLMRMTVSRARLLAPLAEISIPVSPAALVIGGGGAGLCSARALLREGYDVHVVEKDQEFGGHLRQLTQTMSGHSPGGFLDAVLSELRASGRVHLHQRTAVIAHTGSVGSYLTTLRNEHGEEWEIKHGVVVVATGGREAPVVGFGYGESPRVILASEFERRLAGSGGQLADISSAAVILCAGSLNAERPYCSRICCSQSVKNVLRLRERLPAARISVYHRGIRTYGLDELAYLNARQAGIRFLRYDPARPPSVALEHQTPSVLFHDPLSGLSFRDPVDTVILATGIVPEPGAQEIAHHLHLPATPDGFFQEAHVKLRPLDFANEGMYLCGLAHGPKQAEESIAQAIGTAARASAILSRELLALPPNIAVVDSERCAACLTCVRLCPYHVPRINADGVAEIDPAQCHGCGSCASGCPAKAIHVQHHRDDQFLAQCEAWR